MLTALAIRDIVIIDTLDLDLSKGLTVLTGETGAGKSILLDSMTLALGGRGDGGLVRSGAAQGQVTAVFDIAADHPARLMAQEMGLDVDGELILRRIQMADGRTRGFINDQAASAQSLRMIGDCLIEIHGQHDDRALADPKTHRALVDAFGALSGETSLTRAAHSAWRKAESELGEEESRIAAARKEADFLRHAHAELSKLAPDHNEEEQLATHRTAMQQAEKVAVELKEAYEGVGGDHSPVSNISSLMRRLDRRAAQAPALVEPSLKALNDILTAFDAAESVLSQALRDADFDPNELERTEERLFALRAASRKYNVPVADLRKLADKYAADLEALDASEARLIKLEQAVSDTKSAYVKAAADLSKKRNIAAASLDKTVARELPPLKLERAKFITHIISDAEQQGPDGIDRVEFWVETNPGSKPGPLMKVASGGELARFMLALKVALADKGSAPTLIFDEIDTGAGGAVADAIGQRLSRLSAKVQVLAVTHAPQVAARARNHFRITKSEVGGRVNTRVLPLEPATRREEIARMLSGAEITDEARAAAHRLLEGV